LKALEAVDDMLDVIADAVVVTDEAFQSTVVSAASVASASPAMIAGSLRKYLLAGSRWPRERLMMPSILHGDEIDRRFLAIDFRKAEAMAGSERSRGDEMTGLSLVEIVR